MKPLVHRILGTSTAILLLAVMAVLLVANAAHRRQLTCGDIAVEFGDTSRFVTEEDVRGWIAAEYGNVIGERLDSVGLDRMENILNAQSAVLRSEAYITPDGVLHVKVIQRDPVLKFVKGETSFFVDSRGYMFPTVEGCGEDVPVVSGAIPVTYAAGYKGKAPDPKEEKWLAKMTEMMTWIEKSRVWGAGVGRVYVDGNGDVTVEPREGGEKFIFGTPEDFEDKFSRISRYYSDIKTRPDGASYKTVNLKYDGQIVCRK